MFDESQPSALKVVEVSLNTRHHPAQPPPPPLDIPLTPSPTLTRSSTISRQSN